MKFKKIILFQSFLFGLILTLVGCSAISGHSQSMSDFNKILLSNNCELKIIDEKIEEDNDVILWGIQGGSLARNCENYKKSIEFFDKAEEHYKENVDKDSIASNVSESTTSILINNNVNDYEGNIYEKVMVNTYKALNFANLGDHSNARVEFNRALDRQRRAKDYFEKEIKEKQEELEKKSKDEALKNKDNRKTTAIDTEKIAKNDKTQNVIYKEYDDLLNDFIAYPDFINPFTTYISGVYFLLNNDSQKARDLFKESLRMDPKNKQIKNDYALSKKYYTGIKKSKQKYAWVIYENGQGMVKDEMRIDIPLFIVSNKINYTGIALPKIKERNYSYDYLIVNNQKTLEICNMDNVIKTEFKIRFPSIVTESVMNLVIKTYAQYQLKENSGLVGGLLGAVYQGLTNKADVRSWTALPKSFQSVRVPLNKENLEIKNDKGHIIKSIIVPKGKNALIYVKSQVYGNDKVHKTLF